MLTALNEIAWDPLVPCYVNVTTNGDKVTLTGTVHDWHEYSEASRAAWLTPGVTIVDNRITIE